MKKICNRCNLELPLSEEFFAYRENGIFRAQCRKCINKSIRLRQSIILQVKRENRKKALAIELELFNSGYKKCTNCNQELTLLMFNKHKMGRFKLDSTCKNCKQHSKDASKPYLRKCTECGLEATTTDMLPYFKKGKSFKYGRRPICKVCLKSREAKTRYKGMLERRCKKFGISVVEYTNMVSTQNNSCAICKKHKDDFSGRGNAFHIDHCHISGRVRGLLCSNCNTGLGQFKDNIKFMENAIQYLS
jgi:hypothetical protein